MQVWMGRIDVMAACDEGSPRDRVAGRSQAFAIIGIANMCSAVWKKLNLKNQSTIVVLNAPESFEAEIDTLAGLEVIRKLANNKKPRFLLAFVTKQSEIRRIASQFVKLGEGDVTVWFAYPKGSSK